MTDLMTELDMEVETLLFATEQIHAYSPLG